MALNWHEVVWTSSAKGLESLGVKLSKLESEIAIENDKYGEIRKLRSLSKLVDELIESRIKIMRLAEIQKQENECLSELKGFQRADPIFDLIEKLQTSIMSLDHQGYSLAWKNLKTLHALRERFHRRCELLVKLEVSAAGWAHAIRHRVQPHDQNIVPGDTGQAWLYVQWNSILNERYSTDLDNLQFELSQAKEDLQNITAQYVERLAWLAQVERTGLKQQQALTGWLGLQKRITKGGRGVRDARLRRESRELIKECKSAVPVWVIVLPHG